MNIKEYLKDNILLFDGAMGTYFSDKTSVSFENCEQANITSPDKIFDIHREYILSGAKAIKTNTFSANKISLNNDISYVRKIISSGYDIALNASNGEVFIFADIGPIPETSGTSSIDDYIEIVDVFIEKGAENFIFETFPSANYLADISKYIKEKLPNAFILVEFAVTPEGFTRKGISGKKAFYELGEVGTIDAIGFNCVSGPKHLYEFIKKIDFYGKTVSIMPNAGYPTVINNRTFFGGGASYFADQMIDIANLGVSILGGCCGTNPDFILETAKKLKNIKKVLPKRINTPSAISKSHHINKLTEKMDSGKKIIAVELDPPLDTNIDFFMESAKKLKAVSADAITIADCPIARARVDSSLLACKIKKEIGIETIPHLTCRDRNINATKALLLGLSIEDIENVLVVTGDPIPSAQRDDIKAMFSFNSTNLASYISSLNESIFKKPFLISGALNINARNFDSQLKHAEEKIRNGVSMFLTQPVFSETSLNNLIKAKNTLDAKILGGIIPIISYRNACFMNNEISGIDIPDNIIAMYENIEKEEALKLAVSLSVKLAKDIQPYVDGYYLMTPLKKIDVICEIISNIKNI